MGYWGTFVVARSAVLLTDLSSITEWDDGTKNPLDFDDEWKLVESEVIANDSDIMQLLADLAARGVAIVMVSSELPEILGLSDRVVVMRAGRIVEAGPTARIFDAPSESYTRELIAAIPHLPQPEAVPV